MRERHQVEVRAVRFDGAEQSRPAPGVIESIERAEAIVFAPSNPVTSIGPILAVPGIREALRRTAAPVAAVSPIVGGAAVSGPAGELMKMMGWPSTIAGVAKAYEDFLDVLVADRTDAQAISNQQSAVSQIAAGHRADSRSPIPDLDRSTTHLLRVVCTNTIMRSAADKRELAEFVLNACATPQGAKA